MAIDINHGLYTQDGFVEEVNAKIDELDWTDEENNQPRRLRWTDAISYIKSNMAMIHPVYMGVILKQDIVNRVDQLHKEMWLVEYEETRDLIWRQLTAVALVIKDIVEVSRNYWEDGVTRSKSVEGGLYEEYWMPDRFEGPINGNTSETLTPGGTLLNCTLEVVEPVPVTLASSIGSFEVSFAYIGIDSTKGSPIKASIGNFPASLNYTETVKGVDLFSNNSGVTTLIYGDTVDGWSKSITPLTIEGAFAYVGIDSTKGAQFTLSSGEFPVSLSYGEDSISWINSETVTTSVYPYVSISCNDKVYSTLSLQAESEDWKLGIGSDMFDGDFVYDTATINSAGEIECTMEIIDPI